MAKEMSRRSFLKTGAAAALGLAVVPSTVLGKKFGYTAPSDKLNILGVGVGGRGAADLQAMESQNIIGLCDVDWKYADHVFKRYCDYSPYALRRLCDRIRKRPCKCQYCRSADKTCRSEYQDSRSQHLLRICESA